MARDEKRRQKALIKKMRRSKQIKKEKHGAKFDTSGFCENKKIVIKHANEFPLHECLINPQWQEMGMAIILISRRQANKNLVFGNFMVDIFCLGLKNTFCNANISLNVYENNLKPRMYQKTSSIESYPRLAHRIIYGAIDYAASLGFKPQKDFSLSRFILDEPSENDSFFDVEFGKDGKPFYIAGPDDDINYIKRKLSARIGEENFDFMLPYGEVRSSDEL